MLFCRVPSTLKLVRLHFWADKTKWGELLVGDFHSNKKVTFCRIYMIFLSVVLGLELPAMQAHRSIFMSLVFMRLISFKCIDLNNQILISWFKSFLLCCAVTVDARRDVGAYKHVKGRHMQRLSCLTVDHNCVSFMFWT